MKGLFVSHRCYIAKIGGGAQVCTNEYIDLIKTAGISLEYCLLNGDKRVQTRFARRIFTSPYFRPAEQDAPLRIADMAKSMGCELIFLNQVALAALAAKIKKLLPSCKIVVLSHGLESTDFLHSKRLKSTLPLTVRCSPATSVILGEMILKEAQYRLATDAVLVLSSFDADLERWLGSPRVCWIPRSVDPAPIDWKPLGTRLGFVGTLDHAPNLEGLLRVLDRLAAKNLGQARLRIISNSVEIAGQLTEKYRFVDYLGSLDDDALQQEAATWNAFLNPIFCLPRGCSTKLATALNWQIPLITTPSGCRGYDWKKGSFTLVEDPDAFAEVCLNLLNNEEAKLAQLEIIALSESSPRLADNARMLIDFLNLPFVPKGGISLKR